MNVLDIAEKQSSLMLDEYLRPIAPHLAGDITDLCINRPRELWTRDSAGWHHHDAPQLTLSHCAALAKTIAAYNGKPEMPILSAALPGGLRAQVVSSPACEAKTVSVSIRKPSQNEWTLEQLKAAGTFAECREASNDLLPFEQDLLKHRRNGDICDFLHLAVRSFRNILIVGKTGSGKTTVTKALSDSIPVTERVITIEDVHELFMRRHPNKVHLFYSRDDDPGVKVTAAQALASCLRMRPDRIWLAEVRGPEAWEYVKSIGTGHPGSIASMHANGALQAFDQLAGHVKDSGTGAHLDIAYIRKQLIATIDIVLYFDDYKLRELYYDPEAKRAALV